MPPLAFHTSRTPQYEKDVNAILNTHAKTDPILRHFGFEYLPDHQQLKNVSFEFARLAAMLVEGLHRSEERSIALRKLLEGKDAAVRARLEDVGASFADQE